MSDFLKSKGWQFKKPPSGVPFELNKKSRFAKGLLGWWSTIGSSGNRLIDYSGNGAHGTFSSSTDPTYIQTDKGNILDFDGNDYVVIPTADYLRPPYITISIWTFVDTSTSDYGSFFTHAYRTSAWSSPWSTWNFLRKSGDNRWQHRVTYGSGSELFTTSSSYLFTEGWHHLVLTYDGTYVRGYIDGKLDIRSLAASGAPVGLDYHSDKPNITIGVRSEDDLGEYSKQKGQDYRIYNYSFSAEQVEDLYNTLIFPNQWELYKPKVDMFAVVKAGTGATSVTIQPDEQTTTLALPATIITTVKNVSITADKLETTLSLPDPTILPVVNISVSTGVQQAVLELKEPSTIVTSTVTQQPAEQIIALSLLTPTVIAGEIILITPAEQTIALALPAPTITTTDTITLTPNEQTTTLSLPTPTVSVITNISVSADTQTGTLSLLAPTIIAGGSLTLIPNEQTIALALPALTITAVKNIIVLANTLADTLSLPTPVVSAATNVLVSVDIQTLTTTLKAPTISTTDTITITPSEQTTALALLAPTLVIEGGIVINADTVVLTTALKTPMLSTAAVYSGNASWGLDIDTFALVKTKTSKTPVWNTSGRPIGSAGKFGWNKDTNKFEVYDEDSSSWYAIDATQL